MTFVSRPGWSGPSSPSAPSGPCSLGDKTSETEWEDALQRLKTVTDPEPFDAQSAETFYDDATNRTRVRDRKGRFTVTQFDSLGRVVWVRRGACDEAGTPSETCETVERNEYDGSSNKVLTVDGVGNKTRFGYDTANRLVEREEGFEAEMPRRRHSCVSRSIRAGE